MVSLDDVEKAHERIGDTIHKTPVLTSSLLNERCGLQVYLKTEHLQSRECGSAGDGRQSWRGK